MYFYIGCLDLIELNDGTVINFGEDEDPLFILTNEASQFAEGITSGLREFAGSYIADQIFNSVCTVTKFIENEQDDKVIADKSHLYYGLVQGLLIGLWFVKDNSVNIKSFTVTETNTSRVNILKKNVMTTNSKGDYESIKFDDKEIEEVKSWFYFTTEFMMKCSESYEKKELKKDGYNSLSKDINQNVSSYVRAIRYVHSARNESFLPAKIASYISVLETLFFVKAENTHQTAERAAFFIGKNFNEKFDVYQKVKDAYGVRSSYVHGSNVSNTLNKKLEEISANVDSIVRFALKKAMVEFPELDYGSQKQGEKVNDWFIELIFK